MGGGGEGEGTEYFFFGDPAALIYSPQKQHGTWTSSRDPDVIFPFNRAFFKKDRSPFESLKKDRTSFKKAFKKGLFLSIGALFKKDRSPQKSLKQASKTPLEAF